MIHIIWIFGNDFGNADIYRVKDFFTFLTQFLQLNYEKTKRKNLASKNQTVTKTRLTNSGHCDLHS